MPLFNYSKTFQWSNIKSVNASFNDTIHATGTLGNISVTSNEKPKDLDELYSYVNEKIELVGAVCLIFGLVLTTIPYFSLIFLVD